MARYIIFLATILFVIQAIFGQCNLEKARPFFKRSVYEFSVELSERLAKETENHFVSSPFSVFSLLSATSLGADGVTLQEIRQTLRLHHHKCFNQKFFEIVQGIADNTKGTLERSSTLFVDDSFPLNPVFQSSLKKTKICDLKALSFKNFEEVATLINDYVNKATHGNIDEVVRASDLDGVYLVLIDALFFKANWKNKFPSYETEISEFYDSFGNNIGDANLMFSENQEGNTATVQQLNSTVLELFYEGERFSLLIILPELGVQLPNVLESLKTVSLQSILNLLGKNGPDNIMVQMPRFKINTDMDYLKDLLIDMGLSTTFDQSAQFPYISDYNIYISDLIQKANVEVTEEGMEASVATGALFAGRSLQPQALQFSVNRPFLFMVVDKYNEIPLFTGAYSKPTLY